MVQNLTPLAPTPVTPEESFCAGHAAYCMNWGERWQLCGGWTGLSGFKLGQGNIN